jgi:RNA 2',3'-cyclic 3'-phosphodiesterase
MARIRTFIGVDIGDEIRKSAVALQKRLAQSGAAVKWVAPESLHITMLFLGELDERDIVPVCRGVEGAARREPAFLMRATGVGAFPTLRRPKVLWAGISDGAEPLRRLYSAIEENLLDLGVYRKEERGYTPHLTLGRTRSEADGLALVPELAKLQAWEGGRTTVDEVLVYSSEQGRDGPEYAVLARGELAPEAIE